MTACDRCLRRSALLAALAPWIARSLDEHRRLPALLALPDADLVRAVCGSKRAEVEQPLARFDAGRARRAAAAAGLVVVCHHDPGYPPRLLEADDAPALLCVAGAPERIARLAGDPAVAIVGSRRASPYGLEVARALGRDLAAAGVTVVSGMALGVDSAAHVGALEAGGATAAVLAGGADVPYPPSKRSLYARIVASGLVVSELPPGFRAFRWCFPARNRIMAAVSAMTVVVEGAADSGSLITARFAADLGREVGAVPGQVTSALACGPNGLLADGACVVRSAADVLDALYGAGAGRPAPLPAPSLDPRLAALLEQVEMGAGSVDALARSADEVADVLAGLSELELLGLVRRTAGGSYVRCPQRLL
jgi:DNA processing protein